MRNRPFKSRTALLVVDVQVGLVALMSAKIRDSVLPKIKTLLTKARSSGIPVIYIQHDGGEGHPLETHTKGWKIFPKFPASRWRVHHQEAEINSYFETHTLQQELPKKKCPSHRCGGID